MRVRHSYEIGKRIEELETDLAACRALLKDAKTKGYLSHKHTCRSLRGSYRCSCGYGTHLKAITTQVGGDERRKVMSEPKHKSYCNYPNDPCDCGVSPMYAPGSGFSRNPKLYTKGKSEAPSNIDLGKLREMCPHLIIDRFGEGLTEYLGMRLREELSKQEIQVIAATMLELAQENERLKGNVPTLCPGCGGQRKWKVFVCEDKIGVEYRNTVPICKKCDKPIAARKGDGDE